MQLTDYRLPTTAQKAEDSRLKTVDRTSAGFTLVELLVAMSVIALLITISIASYDTLTKNARDSQRKTDLKTIQSALEQYNRDQGFYPAADPNPFTPGSPLTNLVGNPTTPAPSSKSYLNKIPEEAVDSTNYQYAYVPSPASCDNVATNTPPVFCTSYCLYATMENSSNAGFALSPATCNDSSKGNYSVASP